MATDVIMPQMGESIFEGTITKWLKKPGEHVEKDEPLFEISTDKVDAEIPSPAAGTLTEIKFPEGTTVTVNAVVAVIGGAEQAPAKPQPARSSVPDAPKTSSRTKAAAAPEPPSSGVPVVMPQMGESIFEGTITKWLKQVGDRVEKDEPLFEISTDKVDAEIPSPAAGIVTEIKELEGATVSINTVVAVIGGVQPIQAQDMATSPNSTVHSQVPSRDFDSSQASVQQTTNAEQAGHLRSSPLVRRIAKEHSVNLRQVRGTGSAGRITKQDILGFLAVQTAPDKSVRAQMPSAGGALQVPGELVPMSKMRAIIGQRMVESLQISPHAHTVYKIDMTRVARVRGRERAAFEQRYGVKLTYMPFIAAAAVEALRRFPILNASLEGSSIRHHQSVHLGIAVALEWGLIVPVVRNAEQRSFIDLARAIADLANRARAKKLMPDETSGSTFTLTNSGAFGGEFGTPIINQPESAILAIGGLRKEPAVLTDAEGNDTIAIRSVQYYCLGFDHRLIDGADSGKFMLEFKRVLETWDRNLL